MMVADGSMERITPFIVPTYSSQIPKSVRSVMMDMAKERHIGPKSEHLIRRLQYRQSMKTFFSEHEIRDV